MLHADIDYKIISIQMQKALIKIKALLIIIISLCVLPYKKYF